MRELTRAEKEEKLALLEEKERRRHTRRMLADINGVRADCQTLAGFIKHAWHILEPRATLVWGWHMDAICQHLEAVTNGKITRLLINVPPGSSKSMIVSVLWPAWEWAIGLGSMRYLTTAFNEIPVKRDTRKMRDLVRSEWYRTTFPKIKLVRAGEMSFANTLTGTREGVPFGSLTSQRGDRLIIDDPHSVKLAESDPERENTTRLFEEGAINRLNDQTKSAIIVIMQRLHEADMSGVILSNDLGYVHLCIPMEFEADARCVTPIWRDPRRDDGELMDPVRFPQAILDRDFKRNAYLWAGQYQQRPSPRGGGFFKPDMIEVMEAVPAGITEWVRGWDLAASTNGDWTVGLLMGKMKDGRFLIADIKRERFTPDMRDALIRNTATQDGLQVKISIPKDPAQAGKTLAMHHVRMLAGYPVEATPELGTKETRAEPFSAQVNVGNVVMLRGKWNKAFTDELGSFPRGRHDDQIDAGARAFNKLAFGVPKAFIAMPIIVSGARPSPGS